MQAESAKPTARQIGCIHAEAYPAGELKHGPLALVTSEMPAVAIAPNDALLEKLESNLQEVRARAAAKSVTVESGSPRRRDDRDK